MHPCVFWSEDKTDMLIKEMIQPDIAAIRDIRELETICKRHEGLRGTISLDQAMNFNPEIKSFYLLYEEEKLVGVLSLFIPTPAAAEVSAYTAPDKRSQGHFTALLERAAAELKRYNIPELLLVCESRSQSGKAVLTRLGANYRFTEYLMCYGNTALPETTESLNGSTPNFTWERATWDDLAELIPAGMRIFGDNEADSRSMLTNTLKSSDREEWVARWEGRIIGMVGIEKEQGLAFLFGLGIEPDYRGRGYGQALLEKTVFDLRLRGFTKIALEVESGNTAACNLYRKCRFQVVTAFEYHSKLLSEIH